jgi:hypothetical protein
VHLDAEWELVRPCDRKVLAAGSVRVREPIGGPGYDEITPAMSRALETLSRDFAPAVSGASVR